MVFGSGEWNQEITWALSITMSMMSDQGFSNQFERRCAHDFK